MKRGMAGNIGDFRPRAERIAAGTALRLHMPRKSHAEWRSPRRGRDPIEILEASNRGRLRELVPLRYGRVVRSPLTFLRGSAGWSLEYLYGGSLHTNIAGSAPVLLGGRDDVVGAFDRVSLVFFAANFNWRF